MALTQTDLDALDVAIASSELEVRLEGRAVTYRSMTELLQARAHVASVIAAGSATTRRSNYGFQFVTQRGD
jgi:hypothetical protein